MLGITDIIYALNESLNNTDQYLCKYSLSDVKAMEKVELMVWCTYGTFIFVGLLIFIGISCYVKSKLRLCEERSALMRKYSKNINEIRGNPSKQVNHDKDRGKETFSLFNLLS